MLQFFGLVFREYYKLPIKTINNITGIDYKQLSNNQAIIDNKKVSLPSIRPLLFRCINYPKRKSPLFAIENVTAQDFSNLASNKNNEFFMRYGINTVQQLLSLSDMGISLTEAATTLNISRDDAEALAERAYKISNIINTRDKSRFIKADLLERVVLTPLRPQEQRDYRLLTHLNTNGSILRTKSNDDWQWFMKTCYQKISVSKAYISFPKSKAEDFKRFIRITTQLLPAKNWLITTDDKPLDTDIDKNEYQGMRYQQNLSVSTFRIGIASREVRDLSNSCVSTKNTWKYSPLFRFFIHMMLIMDESLTIGEDEP